MYVYIVLWYSVLLSSCRNAQYCFQPYMVLIVEQLCFSTSMFCMLAAQSFVIQSTHLSLIGSSLNQWLQLQQNYLLSALLFILNIPMSKRIKSESCCCSWGPVCQQIRDAIMKYPFGNAYDMWKQPHIQIKCSSTEKKQVCISTSKASGDQGTSCIHI